MTSYELQVSGPSLFSVQFRGRPLNIAFRAAGVRVSVAIASSRSNSIAVLRLFQFHHPNGASGFGVFVNELISGSERGLARRIFINRPLIDAMAVCKCVYGTASGTIPEIAPLSRTRNRNPP